MLVQGTFLCHCTIQKYTSSILDSHRTNPLSGGYGGSFGEQNMHAGINTYTGNGPRLCLYAAKLMMVPFSRVLKPPRAPRVSPAYIYIHGRDRMRYWNMAVAHFVLCFSSSPPPSSYSFIQDYLLAVLCFEIRSLSHRALPCTPVIKLSSGRRTHISPTR